jgi:hypothetical protein
MYMTVVDIVATFDDDVKLSSDMKGVLAVLSTAFDILFNR